MTKKTARFVNQQKSKNTVIVTSKSKDFDVTDALKLLFGKDRTTNIIVNNVGFSCGYRKAIQSDDFANFPATASLNLDALRAIGFNENHIKLSIIESLKI